MGKKWVVLVVGLAMVGMVSPAAVAQGYGGEYNQPATGLVDALKTGQTHALNSSRSETLRDSLWHLGHVVNCLEGLNGKHYDAKNANPCEGQGSGIIPDLQLGVRRYQPGASKALDLASKADQVALDGLKLTDLMQVKAAASKAAAMLGDALKALGQ